MGLAPAPSSSRFCEPSCPYSFTFNEPSMKHFPISNDAFFDPWRHLDRHDAQHLVDYVAGRVEQHERAHGLRKRRRRPADAAAMRYIVQAIVANVAHRAVTAGEYGAVAVDLDNTREKTRDVNPCIGGTTFPYLVRTLAALDIIQIQSEGNRFDARRTTVRASEYLLDQIHKMGITFEDFDRLAGEEIVLLKSDKAVEEGGKVVCYADNEVADGYRRELRETNEQLKAANIGYNGEYVVDLKSRQLVRYFNNARWDHGGRMFRGFWQNMPKRERPLLTIGDYPVVTLDYSTMLPRLAYASIGRALPGDAYELPGVHSAHRGSIKSMFAAMLFASRPLKRYPKDIAPVPGVTAAELCDAIMFANPYLNDLWFRRLGFELMFAESEILTDVLGELRGKDITALPIHDAVVVPADAAETAAHTMVDTFRRHTGQPTAVH